MTDKEKIKAEIKRQIAELTPTKEKIGIVGGMAVRRHLESILSFIDSLQEEPIDYDKLNTMLDNALSKETKESWNERLDKKESVTSVWHDASEEPEVGRAILLYGKDMCIPTKAFCAEYNKNYVIIQQSDKWAYLDDLLNLTHSVTKISDQEESEWLKELQDKLNSLSKEEFGKVLAKYDKYDEVKEPVSEDLEKISKEWLSPRLDKSYTNYGEGKMMELTHFDGYAMLDAIEFGAQWQKKRMMKDAIDTTIKQGCIDLGILIKGLDKNKFSFGDKVKVIIIKED